MSLLVLQAGAWLALGLTLDDGAFLVLFAGLAAVLAVCGWLLPRVTGVVLVVGTVLLFLVGSWFVIFLGLAYGGWGWGLLTGVLVVGAPLAAGFCLLFSGGVDEKASAPSHPGPRQMAIPKTKRAN